MTMTVQWKELVTQVKEFGVKMEYWAPMEKGLFGPVNSDHTPDWTFAGPAVPREPAALEYAPNLAHINLWYEALKSGQYKQVTGEMRTRDGSGFCALGVGYAVYLKHVGMTWEGGAREERIDRARFFAKIVSWFGLPELDIPLAISNGSPTRVTTLNDLGKLTFNEIADLIWAQYLEGKDIPEPDPVVRPAVEEDPEEEKDGAPFGAPDGPVQTDWLPNIEITLTFDQVPPEWLKLIDNTAKELVPA